MIGILVAALVAAVLTAAITPFVRQWVEKHNVVDQPEARRVNTTPKPRAGGVAIYLGFVIAVILTVTWRHFAGAQHAWSSQTVGVLLATTFVALTGLIDDFRDLRPKWQILAIVGAGPDSLCLWRSHRGRHQSARRDAGAEVQSARELARPACRPERRGNGHLGFRRDEDRRRD